MTYFLLKFEAIESRIASHSCPRGTTGRVHSLRLRRWFQSYSRQQTVAIEAQESSATGNARVKSTEDTLDGHNRGFDGAVAAGTYDSPLKLGSQGFYKTPHDENEGVSKSETIDRRKQISRSRRIWGWNLVPGGRSTLPDVSEQDILPVKFEHNVGEGDGPNDGGLYEALRIGNPHNVLKSLLRMVRFDGFDYYTTVLRTIPANTFSEILRYLDPQYFVGRYGRFHKEISQTSAQVLGVPAASRLGYHQFCTIFLSQIHGIIKARHRDHTLSLSDYKYLLKCARVTGNINAARDVWMSMTALLPSGHRNPVIPDGECFNHYLATMTWSDPASPLLKNRLRVIPDNFNPRSWPRPPYMLRGHTVGPENGIKVHISQIFRQMVKAGVPGDEETFCSMMIGFAREGDVISVGSTLKRVWGIDVDSLVSVDESELQPVKRYSLDSPFYPSAKILHTISHAYGINNDIPTALRVVDYISRKYSIAIPTPVWNELLQWTHVLSVRRYGARVQQDGTSIGQLPQQAVSNIWSTMTSPPYNIKPTMEMYNILISNLLRRQRYGDVKTMMIEARLLHIRSVRKLSRQFILLRSTFQAGDPDTENRMRNFQFMKMRVMRNREYIKRWVRLLIWNGSRDLKFNPTWSTHDLPKILKEWKLFIPKRVDYPTDTGNVRFWTDVVVDNGAQQRKWRVGFKSRQERYKKLVRRRLEERDSSGFMEGSGKCPGA